MIYDTSLQRVAFNHHSVNRSRTAILSGLRGQLKSNQSPKAIDSIFTPSCFHH